MGEREGAVGVTTVLLAGLTTAGLAVALWPCSLPTAAAANGLDDSGSAPAAETELPTGTFTASDGMPLAYYAFVPQHPVATLLFYRKTKVEEERAKAAQMSAAKPSAVVAAEPAEKPAAPRASASKAVSIDADDFDDLDEE